MLHQPVFNVPSLAVLQSSTSCIVYCTTFCSTACLLDSGHVLVLLQLDYSNATLAGIPACLLNRLQTILNAAARLITGLRRLTTSLMLLTVYTGYEHPRISGLNCQSVSTKLFITLHLCTCLTCCITSLICHREVDFGHQIPDFLSSTLQDLSPLTLCCWTSTVEQSTSKRPVCFITNNTFCKTRT